MADIVVTTQESQDIYVSVESVASASAGIVTPYQTLGDLIYGGAGGIPTRLAGNTTSNREFLMSQGSSGIATAPSFTGLISGDISTALGYTPVSPTTLSSGLGTKQNIITTGSTTQYFRGDLSLATLNTSVVPEGNNLYYTTARVDSEFDTRLATKTTDSLAEGTTNLYFTNTRADGRIALQKGAVSGLATLDGTGKIPSSQLPATVINETYVVASQAAMLALSANVGDIAVRSDVNQTFILQATPASVLGNWVEFLVNQSTVTSVFGRTGAVVGTSSDITTALGYTPAHSGTNNDITSLGGMTIPLTPSQGGTGQSTLTGAFDALSPTTNLGDTIYNNGTHNVRLAGNTTATKKFYTQTGNGSISANPVWNTVSGSDVGKSIRKLSASFTFNTTDETVEVDTTSGAITGTLQLLSSVVLGAVFSISIGKGTNSATILAAGSDKISNVSSWIFNIAGSTLTVQASTSQWIVI